MCSTRQGNEGKISLTVLLSVILFALLATGTVVMAMWLFKVAHHDQPALSMGVREAMALCGAGERSGDRLAFEEALEKSVVKSKGDIASIDAAQIEFGGGPDGTERFKLYLDCVKEKTTKVSEACTNEQPCVDVERVADFSASHCGDDGKKVDLVTFRDTSSLTPPLPMYTAFIEPRGDVEVHLSDVSSDVPREIYPTENASTREKEYNVPTIDGKVELLWTIAHGHPTDNSGVAFRSLYTIRNLSGKVLLPPGVGLSNEHFDPTDYGHHCVIGNGHTFRCMQLYARNTPTYAWKWNLWSRCEQKPEIGAALEPNLNPLQHVGQSGGVPRSQPAAGPIVQPSSIRTPQGHGGSDTSPSLMQDLPHPNPMDHNVLRDAAKALKAQGIVR